MVIQGMSYEGQSVNPRSPGGQVVEHVLTPRSQVETREVRTRWWNVAESSFSKTQSLR